MDISDAEASIVRWNVKVIVTDVSLIQRVPYSEAKVTLNAESDTITFEK